MPQVHPTAIVEPTAELEEGVVVGAMAYIGARVRIAAGTVIHHHATVEGNTTMGPGNVVFPYAFIGGQTQDLKFKGGFPALKIGARNVFREYCTVHTATAEGDATIIGDDCYFLAYSHVAHECIIGNHVLLGHNSTFGGHIEAEDHAVVGGHTALHPFVRLGRHCYVGGMTKVTQDIPPYMIAEGNPAEIKLINKVGMQRTGHSVEQVNLAMRLFKLLYREGQNRTQALEKLESGELGDDPIVVNLASFIRASKRGLS
ncbi:MAG: acyl-ACP--UDP-N-acetylglucosamine O-acyltransferase [Verrucomicrobiota bacterium JB022]|nr:acyl-ACP--UDP-N-acetylglucosamine O-acyltransferase [Verrucomicrobiota bacterium JB022]